MKHRTTKLAAAALLLIAVYVCLQIPNPFVSTAYAIQETIEACSSVRYLHIKEFYMLGEEKRPSECWIECDDYGRPTRFRLQAPNSGGPTIGPLTIVNDGSGSNVWLPNFNLCYRTSTRPGDVIALHQYSIAELDPKRVCERLYEQHRQGQIVLDVNVPDRKDEPIVVTVTYPQESPSANWQKVLYVDQATRLVNKVEKYEMRDGQYRHRRTIEFLDYNQPIDPEMFRLDGELPEGVIWVDQSAKDVGLAQGDMTDEEIAVELSRQFFEALIAQDYSKAGLLYHAVPGFVIERLFMGAKLLEITSLGEAHAETDPDSNAVRSSCKVLLEHDGQMYELDADMVRVQPVSSQTDRWVICGTSISVYPAPGSIPSSESGVGPDE